MSRVIPNLIAILKPDVTEEAFRQALAPFGSTVRLVSFTTGIFGLAGILVPTGTESQWIPRITSLAGVDACDVNRTVSMS